jgi:hypothetical protein
MLCLVLLCSCSSGGNVKVVNRNLSYKAHIFYFGKEIKLSCVISDNGAEYRVVDGQIKDFTVKINDSGTKVVFENLEKDIKTKNESVYSVLYDVTCFFDGEDYEIKNDDGNYRLYGETDFGKFTYFLTPAGLPLSVEFENGDFSANFYDISIEKE